MYTLTERLSQDGGELCVGDRVKISRRSEYYQIDNLANPITVHGTITEVQDRDEMNIKVEWDNKYHNVYNHSDLALTGGLLWT